MTEAGNTKHKLYFFPASRSDSTGKGQGWSGQVKSKLTQTQKQIHRKQKSPRETFFSRELRCMTDFPAPFTRRGNRFQSPAPAHKPDTPVQFPCPRLQRPKRLLSPRGMETHERFSGTCTLQRSVISSKPNSLSAQHPQNFSAPQNRTPGPSVTQSTNTFSSPSICWYFEGKCSKLQLAAFFLC